MRNMFTMTALAALMILGLALNSTAATRDKIQVQPVAIRGGTSPQPGQPSGTSSSQPGAMSTGDLNNQVQQHFDQARQAYQNRDNQAAANHIRAAAALIAREEPETAGREERGFRNESERLDKLADRVQRGNIKNVDDLNKDFTRVQRTLSKAESKGPGTWESTSGTESPELRSVESSFAQARDAFARRDYGAVQQSLNQAAAQMRQAASTIQDPQKAKELTTESHRVQNWGSRLQQGKKYDASDLDGLINRAHRSMVKNVGALGQTGQGTRGQRMSTQPQGQYGGSNR